MKKDVAQRVSINARKLQLETFLALFCKKLVLHLRPGGRERTPIHLELRPISSIRLFEPTFAQTFLTTTQPIE
ncbi:hypothetical protein [Janthinobacterium sp. J1-1]|uniref:hypothetical protein n=1 Tax=unclassified Janthinobacterium TaxID=2610881 RepID=UPI002810BABA|nr:hypothetical protein [Janthinobacterium sp. J1-1]